MYISSIGASNSKQLMPTVARFFFVHFFLRIPLIDHTCNQAVISASRLQWIIVQPGSLTDKSLTGNYKSGTELVKVQGNPAISRANVAHFTLKELEQNQFVGIEVWLYNEKSIY